MAYRLKFHPSPLIALLKRIAPANLTVILLMPAVLSGNYAPVHSRQRSSTELSAVDLISSLDTGESSRVTGSLLALPETITPNEARTGVIGAYGKLPLSFEPDREGKNGAERFISRADGYTLFASATEAMFVIPRRSSKSNPRTSHRRSSDLVRDGGAPLYDVVQMNLLAANRRSRVVERSELPGRVNYFVGSDPSAWRTNVPTYSRVRYGDVYPGIDLIYYGDGRQLEYDFVVAPGAHPESIRMAYKGTTRMQIDDHGNLLLRTHRGEFKQQKPIVYQIINRVRKEVSGRYSLQRGNQVTFEVETYDRSRPLIIDPTLEYSTYLGGSADDLGFSVAIDSAGSAYVTGRTPSTNFPTVNPFRPTNNGGRDIFITKLNSTGTAILYSTYIGGLGNDEGFGIAVNSSGQAYVTGYTESTNFPLQNALQPFYGGNTDAFLVRLNSTGNALITSTYAGGSGRDVGISIALDGMANIYGIGFTTSSDLQVINAIQPFNAGGADGFLLKLSPAADSIIFSTYAGGSGDDFGLDIDVDSSGFVYGIGDTDSTDLTTVNALQPSNAGGFDAFLAKLTPSGTSIVFSTYAGGSGDDSGQSIKVDTSGNIYAVGFTNSTNFPLQNALQPNKAAGYDAFVGKLNSSGTGIIYSTFLGGNGDDFAGAVAVDTSGNAYLAGETSSTNFPVVNPVRGANAGARDVLVTKLSPTGSSILFSTYLGGSSDESAFGIAADQIGNAFVTGTTLSTNFSTANPLQPSSAGGLDVFLAKITTTGTPTPTPNPNTVQFNAGTASVTENLATRVDLLVTRTGTTSAAATVNYASVDGTASERSDYLAALGTLRFAAGEVSKTITVFIVNDSYGEIAETFSVSLSSPVDCTLGSPGAITVTISSDEAVNGPNPVRDASFNTDFFVRQHYTDFFNREADAPGLAFWKNQIDECTTQACREIRRINVSAAFFLSIEFQETGYLVYKANQAAFNSGEQVDLRDFLPDTQEIGRGVIIGQPGADQQLETNKQKFFNDFVQRPAFLAPTAYPTTLTAAEFVDKLNGNTLDPLNPGSGPALTPSQRDALVLQLSPADSPTLRAQVLRSVSENGIFTQRQFNKAFVLMQYFGYLRRNPDDVPDLNFAGYNFWLAKLNEFNGNFVNAEMVKAFIISGEYQQRFGP